MNSDAIKTALLLGALGVLGYVGYRTYRGAVGVVDFVGDALSDVGAAIGATWDQAAEVAGAVVAPVTNSTGYRAAAATITKPYVPTGEQSVQRRTATDLPEGTYQASAMFWSLYPSAVFYD